MDYMTTDFGADSSSRFFPFRVRTNRQDVTERPTHASSYTAGVGNNDYSHYKNVPRQNARNTLEFCTFTRFPANSKF